ncbi:hypothetical protein P8818_00605 [Bacillus velezensis]|uniref:hypothetical protein n=1 Tax=Bacillus amyloliquefaciens group TaxID=1938374 RepID=UPI002DC0441F|nr:hypothetical protein [Bacillus velezensis]MEC0383420.1 hypothetical protein [Bacillus velezensis]MEC0386094.1 hypothetical protein [Bacillus velezensis]
MENVNYERRLELENEELAEKVHQYQKGIIEIRKYIEDSTGNTDNPKTPTKDDILEVYRKLSELLKVGV